MIKKILIGTAAAGLLLASAVSVFANSTHDNTNLLSNGNNWRVFNIMPATKMFWDINRALYSGTTVSFPFQQFLSTTTGSFVVYLSDNYNVALTDGTIIKANAHWNSVSYANRGNGSNDAYARVEFQDVASGNYTSNDYWWYSGPGGVYNLNDQRTSGSISAPLIDRAHWTNICGQVATDYTPHSGPNCVGGTDPAVSPYDGFTNAMKNVKEVNLSFGRASRYASGVAAVGTNKAVFSLTSFKIK